MAQRRNAIGLHRRHALKTPSAIALVLLLFGTGLLASTAQRKLTEPRRLNPRIGPPNQKRYGSLLDAKDWENPYVVIHRDGIEIILRQRAQRRETVAAYNLAKTLIALPISAWPYGRVVAVQEAGLRAAGRSGDKPTTDNLEMALAVLKKLDVTVERWPP